MAEARAKAAEAHASATEAKASACAAQAGQQVQAAPEAALTAQNERMAELESSLRESEMKYSFLQQEQEELLIFLAEQQVKNTNLEQRLLILEAGGGESVEAAQ